MNAPDAASSTMTRYLLGNLPESEWEEIELAYFRDDDLFEEMLEAEEELTGDYLAGRLSSTDRERFEQRFAATPQGRQSVEFTRALKRVLAQAPVAEASRAEGRVRPSRTGVVVLLAAAVVFLAVGGASLLVQSARLRTDLDHVRGERTALQRRQRELEQQADRQSDRIERLIAELSERRSIPEPPKPKTALQRRPQPRTVSFVLTAGLVRDIQRLNRLTIPAETERVRLQLALEAVEYPSYQAVLQTAAGDELWRSSSLKTREVSGGSALFVEPPLDLLKDGHYVILLKGVRLQQTSEDVSEYFFRLAWRHQGKSP